MAVSLTNREVARLTVRNKYGAKKEKRDGITFDSKAEAARYSELCLLQKAGEIQELKVHQRYLLMVNDLKICIYEADFDYQKKNVLGRWESVTEDSKGHRTRDYRIKAKLFQALMGRAIYETGGKKCGGFR